MKSNISTDDGHPSMTGEEIKSLREHLNLTQVQFMHIMGYSASASKVGTKRLRERCFNFETGVVPLPPSQTRLLMAIGFIESGDKSDLAALLSYGDFL